MYKKRYERCKECIDSGIVLISFIPWCDILSYIDGDEKTSKRRHESCMMPKFSVLLETELFHTLYNESDECLLYWSLNHSSCCLLLHSEHHQTRYGVNSACKQLSLLLSTIFAFQTAVNVPSVLHVEDYHLWPTRAWMNMRRCTEPLTYRTAVANQAILLAA